MDYILWSFLLYILYVLLPIVPAVVIYRLFPKSQAFAQGPLGDLTIKVGGAFGAYVITVLLGYGLANRIDARIDALSEPIWRLSATVALQDRAGKPITDPDAIDQLRVVVEPPLNGGVYPDLEVRLPLLKPDDWPVVRVRVPGFYEKPINIKTALEKNTATRDDRRSIKLKEIQVLRQLPKEQLYASDYTIPTPLRTDGPPAEKPELPGEVCAVLTEEQRALSRRGVAVSSPCVRVQP